MVDKPQNGECPHPAMLAIPLKGQPGKFKCALCGVTGTIMTKSEGGILTPKVWK